MWIPREWVLLYDYSPFYWSLHLQQRLTTETLLCCSYSDCGCDLNYFLWFEEQAEGFRVQSSVRGSGDFEDCIVKCLQRICQVIAEGETFGWRLCLMAPDFRYAPGTDDS
jgi:hypothetical protein